MFIFFFFFFFKKSLGDKTDRYVYSSLGFPFFPQSVVFGPRGFKEAAGDFLSINTTVYKNLQNKSESGSVGYSHSSCSFHYVFVDSTLVLCGRPVRAAIHLLAS